MKGNAARLPTSCAAAAAGPPATRHLRHRRSTVRPHNRASRPAGDPIRARARAKGLTALRNPNDAAKDRNRAKSLTDGEVDQALKLAEWAWVELNYRPHAYQATSLQPPTPASCRKTTTFCAICPAGKDGNAASCRHEPTPQPTPGPFPSQLERPLRLGLSRPQESHALTQFLHRLGSTPTSTMVARASGNPPAPFP